MTNLWAACGCRTIPGVDSVRLKPASTVVYGRGSRSRVLITRPSAPATGGHRTQLCRSSRLVREHQFDAATTTSIRRARSPRVLSQLGRRCGSHMARARHVAGLPTIVNSRRLHAQREVVVRVGVATQGARTEIEAAGSLLVTASNSFRRIARHVLTALLFEHLGIAVEQASAVEFARPCQFVRAGSCDR